MSEPGLTHLLRLFMHAHPADTRPECASPRASPSDDRSARAMRAARNQCRNDRNLLRRAASEDPDAAAVLRDLSGCTDLDPCGSGACSACNTGLQAIATPLVHDLIRGSPDAWWCATIINTRRTIPCGRLAAHRLFEDFEARLHRFLADEGVPAIGCLEISNNEHHADAYPPRYVEHGHFATPLRFTRAVRRRLFEVFPRTNVVGRPVKAKPFDGMSRFFRYAFKPEIWRRVEINRVQADGTRSRYSTRRKPLRSAERVEVAKAMSRVGTTRVVFMHDIELVDTRHGPRLAVVDEDF